MFGWLDSLDRLGPWFRANYGWFVLAIGLALLAGLALATASEPEPPVTRDEGLRCGAAAKRRLSGEARMEGLKVWHWSRETLGSNGWFVRGTMHGDTPDGIPASWDVRCYFHLGGQPGTRADLLQVQVAAR